MRRIEDGLIDIVAEGVGFEPTIPGGIPVFKTGAIVHSAIPPRTGASLCCREWRLFVNHSCGPDTFRILMGRCR